MGKMGEVCPQQVMKALGTAEVQLHSFLSSALDKSQCSTSRSGRFTPEKGQRYTMNSRLEGTRNWSERPGEEKKTLDPTGIRTPDRPARSVVTILTEL